MKGEEFRDGAPDDFPAWAEIARHLETAEVMRLPANFREQLKQRLIRARLRQDFAFAAKVALATGTLLTLIVAGALGLDWWARLAAMARPEFLMATMQRAVSTASAGAGFAEMLARMIVPASPKIAAAFLAASIVTLILQSAVLRALGLGRSSRNGPPFVHT